MDYFSGLFIAKPTLIMSEAIEAVQCKITPEMNEALFLPFTEEGVTKALAQIHPSKWGVGG